MNAPPAPRARGTHEKRQPCREFSGFSRGGAQLSRLRLPARHRCCPTGCFTKASRLGPARRLVSSTRDLRAGSGAGFGIRDHGVRSGREGVESTTASPSNGEAEDTMKKQNRFPSGWSEARVRRVLEHYERQSDVEAVAEDEAAYRSTTTTVMKVPVKLVPAVRALLAKRRAS